MDSNKSPSRFSQSEKDEAENDPESLAATQSSRYPRPLEGGEDEKEEEKEDLRNHHDDDHRFMNGHSHSHYDDNLNHDDDHHNDDDDDDHQLAKRPPQNLEEQLDDSVLSVASRPQHDNDLIEKKKLKSCSTDDDDDDDDEKSIEGPDPLRLERARNSQVIRPGAVAVRGYSSVLRSISTTYTSDDEDDKSQEETESVTNISNDGNHLTESADVVVVVPEEDVERQDEELEERRRRQDEEQAEQFAAHVRVALLQNTVQAEAVMEKPSVEAAKANRTGKRPSRWIFCWIVGAIIVIIVVIIVPIVLTQRPQHHRVQPSGSTNNTTTANNSTPSTTKAPAPFSSCFYCLNLTANLTSDFSNATNLTIFQLLQTGLNHTYLPEFLAFSGLSPVTDSDNITLFAPLDISFQTLPVPYIYYQSNFYWIYHLITILDYHIVVQPLNESEIFDLDQLPTLAGPNITVNGNYSVLADDAKILVADIPATNGYIHITDRVLIPNELRQRLFETANDLYDQKNEDSRFSIFGRLFNLSGLEATLTEKFYFYNGLTLLLPTDEAFKKLDADYLKQLTSDSKMARDFVAYHFVPINAYQEVIVYIVHQINFLSLNRLAVWFSATDHSTPFVSYVNAIPIQESIFASDGLIHVLNDVVMPPTIGEMLLITTSVTASPPYDFNTFVSLAKDPARLGPLLFNRTASEELTVFVPVQDAFDEGDATSPAIRRLLQNSSRWWMHVRSLIQHHCIAQEVHNSDLFVGTLELTMLSGFNISLQVFSEGNVTNDDLGQLNMVDGNYFAYPNFTIDERANVTLNNLIAVNGLIYGIDSLLLPPWVDLSIYETVVERPELSMLAALIKRANLTDVLHDTPGLTLLAPNNAALTGVDVTNVTFVREMVLNHVLLDVVYFADFNMTSVESFNRRTYEVRTVNGAIQVGSSLIIKSAMLASNGVVQGVDGLVG